MIYQQQPQPQHVLIVQQPAVIQQEPTPSPTFPSLSAGPIFTPTVINAYLSTSRHLRNISTRTESCPIAQDAAHILMLARMGPHAEEIRLVEQRYGRSAVDERVMRILAEVRVDNMIEEVRAGGTIMGRGSAEIGAFGEREEGDEEVVVFEEDDRFGEDDFD
ncbi:hypothetical protein CC86DRAFT_410604 [Ophiobolus disseminans]|uniref:Uncharacterized protein n=1 Tax=Ophiobolus disseminans TaxID=1469910 RepID=A0A6A6ZNJ6_9PLEO|nr:hypothetical protein CC86DRAFT_410604 [Ophiobolus disseminans]